MVPGSWDAAGRNGLCQPRRRGYGVDLDHSIVEFRSRTWWCPKTTGHFKDYTGFIRNGPRAGTVKALEATIKTASVTTNHEKRDAHLRNPDFFDVEVSHHYL